MARGDAPSLDVVRQRHHADRLPDAETYPGSDTAVETLDPVLLVDIGQRVDDGLLLSAFRRLRHGLHLHGVSLHPPRTPVQLYAPQRAQPQ